MSAPSLGSTRQLAIHCHLATYAAGANLQREIAARDVSRAPGSRYRDGLLHQRMPPIFVEQQLQRRRRRVARTLDVEHDRFVSVNRARRRSTTRRQRALWLPLCVRRARVGDDRRKRPTRRLGAAQPAKHKCEQNLRTPQERQHTRSAERWLGPTCAVRTLLPQTTA